MREKYESLSLAVLKDLAKARGMKGISTLRKPALIERMLEEDAKEAVKEKTEETPGNTAGENSLKEKVQENEKNEYRTRPASENQQERKEYRTERNDQEHRNINGRRENNRESYNRSAYNRENVLIHVMAATRQKRVRRMAMFLQNPHSWTVVKKPMGSWRYFRMDMDLSAVPTIFLVKTIFMFRLPRSAALI